MHRARQLTLSLLHTPKVGLGHLKCLMVLLLKGALMLATAGQRRQVQDCLRLNSRLARRLLWRRAPPVGACHRPKGRRPMFPCFTLWGWACPRHAQSLGPLAGQLLAARLSPWLRWLIRTMRTSRALQAKRRRRPQEKLRVSCSRIRQRAWRAGQRPATLLRTAAFSSWRPCSQGHPPTWGY